MKSKDVYLKITQDNVNPTVPLLIPLKGLIGVNISGAIVTFWYKNTSAKLAIVVNAVEVYDLVDTIMRAIPPAIQGADEQPYYPVQIYTQESAGVLGGWI
jgi:predicted ATP-grasp superfamily ATP-dependent carboligase